MQLTLAEIAIHIPGSIDLFEQYELDYYQNGKQTLKDACQKQNINFLKIDTELRLLQNTPKQTICLDEYGIEELIYIINRKFHSKEKEIYQTIATRIQNLLQVKAYPKSLIDVINTLNKQFNELAEKLTHHCNKEDKLFFPYIRRLLGMRGNKQSISSLEISLIRNPIIVFESEHMEIAVLLSEIKQLANNFKTSPNIPALYNILLEDLRDFEKNIHIHLHVENNILFPKCIALEEELKKRIRDK